MTGQKEVKFDAAFANLRFDVRALPNPNCPCLILVEHVSPRHDREIACVLRTSPSMRWLAPLDGKEGQVEHHLQLKKHGADVWAIYRVGNDVVGASLVDPELFLPTFEVLSERLVGGDRMVQMLCDTAVHKHHVRLIDRTHREVLRISNLKEAEVGGPCCRMRTNVTKKGWTAIVHNEFSLHTVGIDWSQVDSKCRPRTFFWLREDPLESELFTGNSHLVE